MDKQQHLDLANDYANEADELEASAINAAEVAIASIKTAAENVKGAAIDRTFQKQHEEAAEKDA